MNIQSEDTSQGTFIPPSKYDQEASNKPVDKVKRDYDMNSMEVICRCKLFLP